MGGRKLPLPPVKKLIGKKINNKITNNLRQKSRRLFYLAFLQEKNARLSAETKVTVLTS